MSTMHIDNSDNAANFSNAFEATTDGAQKAPFRMPISISRRRRSRNDKTLPRLGLWESIDRRHASDLHREAELAFEIHGTSTNPEDALIDMIDGTLDEESTALLLGSDEPVEDEHSYFVDGLTDQEKELVLKFGEENPESLHPTKTLCAIDITETVIKEYAQACFCKRWESPSPTDLWIAEIELREMYSYTIPVKPTLEPVDREDENEAHGTSSEFKRLGVESEKRCKTQQEKHRERLRKGGKMKCVRNRGQKHRRYNIDRATNRHQSWSEQLPFCSKTELAYDDYRERITFEASIRHMEEEWEDIKEEGLQFELDIWEDYINFAQEKQRCEYEESTTEERRGEAMWRNEQRRNFLRDYRSNPRLDIATWRALCSYDLELVLEADLDRLEEEDVIDAPLIGSYDEEYDEVG